MALGLRVRLSRITLLEFFVWGAWYPALSVLPPGPGLEGGLGFDPVQIGNVYGLLAFASIFMPIIAGQVTDRWVPTQIFLGIAHLVGGAGIIFAATQTGYGPMPERILLWGSPMTTISAHEQPRLLAPEGPREGLRAASGSSGPGLDPRRVGDPGRRSEP